MAGRGPTARKEIHSLRHARVLVKVEIESLMIPAL